MRPLLRDIPTAYGLGTTNVATVSIVKVITNNYMNVIRQKSNLSIDLLPVRSGPKILMRNNFMRYQMNCSQNFREGDLTLHLTTRLELQGRS